MSRGEVRRIRAGWGPVLSIVAWMLMASVILLLPSEVEAFSRPVQLQLPLEILAFLLLASVLPRAAQRLYCVVSTLLLVGILLLKLADLGMDRAFQRPFNPYLDARLLADGWDLLGRSFGRPAAWGVGCTALVATLLVAAALYRSLRSARHLVEGNRRAVSFALALALLIGSAAFVAQAGHPNAGIAAGGTDYVVGRLMMTWNSMEETARFEEQLKGDPLPPAPQFGALAGLDVVLIFVESYGRSALEDVRYAPRIRSRLLGIQRDFDEAGIHARSGWLTSPTQGGLSWLAHGTLLSGLWIDNQGRYDRLIGSARRNLVNLFRSSGWRTVAIMPAITRDWPEAAYFGYDRIYSAKELGYRGLPFGWITMPDQFTLSAFERLERQKSAGPSTRPLMAQIALISSHAPWTPVPTLKDWTVIGNGEIFNADAQAGDPPSLVWADADRVRRQYVSSIDYVLQALGSYVLRHGKDTLFIVMGDHQPAAIITGQGAGRDVPVHVITSNADLMRRLDDWDWQRGMVPLDKTTVYPMDRFRDRLATAFR